MEIARDELLRSEKHVNRVEMDKSMSKCYFPQPLKSTEKELK